MRQSAEGQRVGLHHDDRGGAGDAAGDGVDPAAVGVGVREPGAGAVAVGDRVEDEREDRAVRHWPGRGPPGPSRRRSSPGSSRPPTAPSGSRRSAGAGRRRRQWAGSRPAARAAWVSGTAAERPPARPRWRRRLVAERQGGAGGRGIRRRAFVAHAVRHAGRDGDGGGRPRGEAHRRSLPASAADAAATRAPVNVLAAMVGTLGGVGSCGRSDGRRRMRGTRSTSRDGARDTGEGRPVVPDRPSRAGWSRPLRRLSLAAGDPVRRTGHCTISRQDLPVVTLG